MIIFEVIENKGFKFLIVGQLQFFCQFGMETIPGIYYFFFKKSTVFLGTPSQLGIEIRFIGSEIFFLLLR